VLAEQDLGAGVGELLRKCLQIDGCNPRPLERSSEIEFHHILKAADHSECAFCGAKSSVRAVRRVETVGKIPNEVWPRDAGIGSPQRLSFDKF
jgi:hypothetical protein